MIYDCIAISMEKDVERLPCLQKQVHFRPDIYIQILYNMLLNLYCDNLSHCDKKESNNRDRRY